MNVDARTRTRTRTRPLRRVIALACAGALGCALGGCASKPAAAPSSMDGARVVVAPPCAALTGAPSHGPVSAILLRVADVSSPLSPSLGEVTSTPVEANQVAGVLLERGVTTAGPWGAGPNDEGELRVRVDAFPENAASPIEIALETAGKASSRAVVRTTNQAPARASLPGTQPSNTVVVTPYYLFEPRAESLRVLIGCLEPRRPSSE